MKNIFWPKLFDFLGQDRVSTLKKMHDAVLDIPDEEAYMTWIYFMPDEPSESDFESIAEDDEEWNGIIKLFLRLLMTYNNDIC
jgi:hypothetical protein